MVSLAMDCGNKILSLRMCFSRYFDEAVVLSSRSILVVPMLRVLKSRLNRYQHTIAHTIHAFLINVVQYTPYTLVISKAVPMPISMP